MAIEHMRGLIAIELQLTPNGRDMWLQPPPKTHFYNHGNFLSSFINCVQVAEKNRSGKELSVHV